MSADLGKQNILQNNEKAVATCVGIIDGTGSFGAAIGQQVIGVMAHHSWTSVLILLCVMAFVSALPILPLAIRETKEMRVIWREKKIRESNK